MKEIKIKVNNKENHLSVKDNETLLEVLRERLNLTGTKYACSDGECGVCTVIVEGKNILSCLTLAADMDGKSVITIEGLSSADKLHPIQAAFIDKGAVQCGFCTPGMILSTKALLDKNKNPNDEEIQQALDGNICRCTGYLKIFAAVKEAAKRLNKINADRRGLDTDTRG